MNQQVLLSMNIGKVKSAGCRRNNSGDLKGSSGLNMERNNNFQIDKVYRIVFFLFFFAYDEHLCSHISAGSMVSTVVQIVDLLKGS